MRALLAAILAVALLPGCAMFKEATQTAAVDTFCLTAKKKMWSRDDSPESIRDARVHNETIDRRCGRGA